MLINFAVKRKSGLAFFCLLEYITEVSHELAMFPESHYLIK